MSENKPGISNGRLAIWIVGIGAGLYFVVTGLTGILG